MATHRQLKLLTYNIQSDVGSVVQTILDADPHVIVLNELQRYSMDFLVNRLNEETGIAWFAAFSPCFKNYGNGIVSRMPIVHFETKVLPQQAAGTFCCRHDRSAFIAWLDPNAPEIPISDGDSDDELAGSLPSQTSAQPSQSLSNCLCVCGTHLDDAAETNRLFQLHALLEFIKEKVGTAHHLLAGDFNALHRPDYSEEEWKAIIELRIASGRTHEGTEPLCQVIPELLKAGYRDAWREAGSEGSFATCWTNRPLMRVDYIFASQHFPHAIVQCCRIESKGSDHFPVKATILWS